MAEIKAAFFDLDGTLLDSMWVWDEIDIEFLSQRGFDVPEDYVAAVSTIGFREAAQYTVDRFQLNESPADIVAQWNAMALDKYSHEVKLKPGALDYLHKLKAQGIKLATATALHDELAAPVLNNTGIFDLFDLHLCTNTIGKSKEHPDLFLHGAQHFGVSPQECAFFEDLLPCIRGGLAAGLTVYGVYDDANAADEQAIRQLAHGFIHNFHEAPWPLTCRQIM